jgi:hypothetical protein
MKTVSLFHSQDGLYFGRLEDGSVWICKCSDNQTPNEGNITFQTTLPVSAWGSVVSTVSLKGETYDTWLAAQNFHNDTSITVNVNIP